MIEEILYDNNLKFNELEIKIFRFVCMVGCILLKLILEKRDKDILNNRDKKRYRHKGYKRDCIKTIMGEVEYRRAIYEESNGEDKRYVFLLNEEIEISTIGKISTCLSEKIINSACENSYRVSAKHISETTNQSISHEGIRNIILNVGKKIYKKEKEKAALYKEDKLPSGEKVIPAIFEEADGLWVSLQGKDRAAAIEKYEEKAKKAGKEYKEPKKIKSELKLYVSYEGWKKDERHPLVGKQYITGFMSIKELNKIRKAKLHEKYNLKEIKLMALNGDGAAWIRKLAVRGQIYQKDSFHISQAVNRNIKDLEDREKLHKMISDKRYLYINDFLESLKYKYGGEEKSVNKLSALQKYLRSGLERYKEKAKIIPESPEGMEYRGMGICESQVFCVLTRRLSGRRMSFSKVGATMLSKVVALKAENHKEDILEVIETPIKIDNSVEEWIRQIEEQVENARAEKKSKLKSSPPIKVLKKPFEGTCLSEGFKAIRNLVEIMPIINYSR